MTQLGYGAYQTIPNSTFGDVMARVKTALGKEGFGILAEMDLAATLEKKLGAKIRPQVVLGACMPELAKQALEMEPHIGLLLPCNVVVREVDGGAVSVAVVHPRALFSLVNNPKLETVMSDVEARLDRVMKTI